jgi:hypothetical protein
MSKSMSQILLICAIIFVIYFKTIIILENREDSRSCGHTLSLIINGVLNFFEKQRVRIVFKSFKIYN